MSDTIDDDILRIFRHIRDQYAYALGALRDDEGDKAARYRQSLAETNAKIAGRIPQGPAYE